MFQRIIVRENSLVEGAYIGTNELPEEGFPNSSDIAIDNLAVLPIFGFDSSW